MESSPLDLNVLQASQESIRSNLAQDARIANSMSDADRIRESIPQRKKIAEIKEKQLKYIILALENEGYGQEQINQILPQISRELRQQLVDKGNQLSGEPPLENLPELAQPEAEEPEKSWREKYQDKYQMDPIKLDERSLAKGLFQAKDYELMKMTPGDASELDFALAEVGRSFSYRKFLLELFGSIIKQVFVAQAERPIIDHIESNIYLTRFDSCIKVIFEKADPKLIRRYISCQSPVDQVIKGLNKITRRELKHTIIDIIEQKCGKAYLKELLLNYKDASEQL